MSSGAIGPGTLLAGRYRLDDLLAEHDGARFWRATDQVLARSVAIHAVPSDDERAAHLLEAARVSATVTDPHLLRVLDCDQTDGITWVVNEWGDGISLDLMLQRGTLPPSRAAWLTREVADAIAAGHARGVPHGRLNPEAVLVTHAGSVKLIGYVVDATLEPTRPPDPLYGDLDAREADVIDLAGILYAALTGRWPGVSSSGVPRAPRDGRRPLRPRQVRAGVPRTLDAICDRVLHKEASQHTMPIETAQEIAAALADYVGDATQAAPLDAAAMHTEAPPAPSPEPSPEPDPFSEATRAWSPTIAATAAVPAPNAASTSTAASPTPVADADAHPHAAADPGTDALESTQVSAAIDLEDTGIHREPLEGPDDLSPLAAPREKSPPPPPFEDPPERPLFASTERRVPAGARSAGDGTGSWTSGGTGGWSGDTGAWGHTGPGTTGGVLPVEATSGGGRDGAEFWPFTDESAAHHGGHTGKEGRGWLRTAVVVGVLLVLVVAMAVAFTRGRQDGTGGATDGGSASSDPSSTASRTGQVLKISGVRDFDPQGDPSTENPETTGNAIDGDPATSWTTLTYRGNPALGGLKDGVGLLVDLGRDVEVGSVRVQLKGAPTTFEVYTAAKDISQFPTSLDALTKVGGATATGERATVTLDPTPTTRYVLVWLTRLPAADGGYRGEVTDITVRS